MNSWETAPRLGAHARDPQLESVLGALNERLRHGKPRDPVAPTGQPILFVLGCARSGTTLLLQWLKASGIFATPTNIVSRFPGDPTTGALVHRALYELDVRGEIFDAAAKAEPFTSLLGRTKGPNEPHDFGYLWSTRFAFGHTQDRFDPPPTAAAVEEFIQDLRGMQGVFGKPFALKAVHFNWHAPLLAEWFPEGIFLHIQRDPLDNARSLLQARRTYFGNEEAWYSFRPPAYDELTGLPPWEQCVAQAVLTDRDITQGLNMLPAQRHLTMRYEELCTSPASVWQRLAERCGIDAGYTGPATFAVKAHAHDAALRTRAQAILDRYSSI